MPGSLQTREAHPARAHRLWAPGDAREPVPEVPEAPGPGVLPDLPRRSQRRALTGPGAAGRGWAARPGGR